MEAAEPSRRERRRAIVRGRILETAVALFETQGYEATTVTEIARRADIAYGTFFNHYPSKLHLLREVSDRALQDLFEDVEELSKRPGSFSEHVVALFEETARKALEKGSQTRELTSAMMALAFPENGGSDDRRMRVAFRHFLEEGRRRGEIGADVDLETLNEIVVGAWYSMFLSWVHYDDYPLCERASSVGRFLSGAIRSSRK